MMVAQHAGESYGGLRVSAGSYGSGLSLAGDGMPDVLGSYPHLPTVTEQEPTDFRSLAEDARLRSLSHPTLAAPAAAAAAVAAAASHHMGFSQGTGLAGAAALLQAQATAAAAAGGGLMDFHELAAGLQQQQQQQQLAVQLAGLYPSLFTDMGVWKQQRQQQARG